MTCNSRPHQCSPALGTGCMSCGSHPAGQEPISHKVTCSSHTELCHEMKKGHKFEVSFTRQTSVALCKQRLALQQLRDLTNANPRALLRNLPVRRTPSIIWQSWDRNQTTRMNTANGPRSKWARGNRANGQTKDLDFEMGRDLSQIASCCQMFVFFTLFATVSTSPLRKCFLGSLRGPRSLRGPQAKLRNCGPEQRALNMLSGKLTGPRPPKKL